MRIFVDADACPVKEIVVRHAKRLGLPVTMVLDTSHEFYDGYSTVVTVDKAKDSADIKLINLAAKGDIVVTQDFGVAAMALGKGAAALNQNGLIYTDGNIDTLLMERHISARTRRAGGRTPNAGKRSPQDNAAFERSLLQIFRERGLHA